MRMADKLFCLQILHTILTPMLLSGTGKKCLVALRPNYCGAAILYAGLGVRVKP